MRWEPAAILGLFALACAAGCGGGGHDNVTITTQNSFPQGLLPVRFASSAGSGDVTLRLDGDLYAVDGRTADVTKVSHTTGEVSTFAQGVGGSGNALLSIVVGFGQDGRLFAGDGVGRIWAIETDGTVKSTPYVDTHTGQGITGLSFAPDSFTGFGGQLFAAAGTAGVLRVPAQDQSVPFSNPVGEYRDLGFSGATLFALDVGNPAPEIDKMGTDGVVSSFQGGFDDPVGMAIDTTASEIYVADAGAGVLYTVPVAGGTPTARAAYSFDPDAPSGIAYDGLAALAFVTTDPPAIRGSVLPRLDPANTNFGVVFGGSTVGYGDLELDRTGSFVLAMNDPDDPNVADDSVNNFLFSVTRDLSSVTSLASSVGSPIEELLGVAVDPVAQTVYFSTRAGNVYQRVSDGTVSLVRSVSASAVLGLELVPPSFGADAGENLIASTATGEVILINSQAKTHRSIATITTTTGRPAPLSDLVFDSLGTLYVVDNGQSIPPGNPRILIVDSDGHFAPLAGVNSAQLGRPDGIEIDEGANRLLVTSETTGGSQLLGVDRDSGAVSPVADFKFPIDDGFFPTGVVYDRLGTAVVRERDDATSLVAHSLAP